MTDYETALALVQEHYWQERAIFNLTKAVTDLVVATRKEEQAKCFAWHQRATNTAQDFLNERGAPYLAAELGDMLRRLKP